MSIAGVGKDVYPLTQSDLRELISGDIDTQCHVREVGDAIKGLPRCSHLVGADVAGHHGSTRGVHDVAPAQSVVHLLHLHSQGAGFFVDAVGRGAQGGPLCGDLLLKHGHLCRCIVQLLARRSVAGH